MPKFLFRSILTALGIGLLVAPPTLQAQLREVVSKEVAVSRSEATLRLEFTDDGELEITFEDGAVLINGDVVGGFVPGDDLEAEWRSLLSQAVSLDNGDLAVMLSDWSAPGDLAGDLADLAQEVDRALEDALSGFDVGIDSDDFRISQSIGDGTSLIQMLLNSTGDLGLLKQAIAGLGGDLNIYFGEDVDVPEGSTVDGPLVVIQGNVRIAGEVDGDVIVVDGTLELLEESRVRGEVRLADARLVRNLGTVEDGLFDLLDEERDLETEIRNQVREEVQAELRSELRRELRDAARLEFKDDREGFSLMAPFRAIGNGVSDLFKNLMGVFVLGLIGLGAVTFAGTNVDAVAETVRRSPGRSAAVGLAGTLLLVPVWLLGTVVLVVSVIGIPVAIAWLPLFPLAACAAGVMGYLVVARNTGEWLADSEYPWTGWIRKSNPIYTMFGGLLGLMFAFMAANVISIAPFLGFVAGLLAFLGSVITFFAIQIGFGAVLLTRAGRRRERTASFDMDAAWAAATGVDEEVDFDVTNDEATEASDHA